MSLWNPPSRDQKEPGLGVVVPDDWEPDPEKCRRILEKVRKEGIWTRRVRRRKRRIIR